jgi:hypothetical protein
MEQPLNLVISMAIDSLADSALRARPTDEDQQTYECDACKTLVKGEPAGRGLYVWSRGEEVRYEEPPLCGRCATAIGMTALAIWSMEEEEG